jgi:hypothetical protein
MANFLYLKWSISTVKCRVNPLNAELNRIWHLLILVGDLTFMGPCIVSIFQYTGCPRRNMQNFGSVPYVKIYRYNPKHIYPKLKSYGDNGQRKVWSSCGSTYCTCSADTSPVHCACPSLRVSLLPTSRLRYEQLVTCTEMLCSMKGRWYTCKHVHMSHVICLEP